MYQILDHTSDLEVLVESNKFESLVEESVKAVTDFVADNVELSDEREVRVEGDPSVMLMGVLEQVVYLQSGENFYVAETKAVAEGGGITVFLRGGPAHVKDEIKAVTWYDFWVKGNKAHFICDL